MITPVGLAEIVALLCWALYKHRGLVYASFTGIAMSVKGVTFYCYRTTHTSLVWTQLYWNS